MCSSLVKDTFSPSLLIWQEVFCKMIYLLAPPSGVEFHVTKMQGLAVLLPHDTSDRPCFSQYAQYLKPA